MPATFRAMSVFARAVEMNSFVGAARSLLIDPAVVTRIVKALETDLGVLLFARSTRTLKLTAEGQQFYRVEILQKHEEATQRYLGRRADTRGRLTVGVGSAMTRRMLLRAVRPFQQRYRDVELVLLSASNMTEIGGKGVDVLIRTRNQRQRGGVRQVPQGLVVRTLARPPLVACSSPEYLKIAGVLRAPADLLRHDCVAHVSMDYDIQDEWQFSKSLQRQKIKIVPKLLVQGTEALREAALAGCGIVRPLPCHVYDELRSGKLVPVLADWELTGAMPIIAIYRKTRPMLPQVNLFVSHLAEAFRHYTAPMQSSTYSPLGRSAA
jgi:LysR family transcriptional regulator for bpeEF and oprC